MRPVPGAAEVVSPSRCWCNTSFIGGGIRNVDVCNRIDEFATAKGDVDVAGVSARASQILRTRELLRALEDHEAALGDLVDRESFVAQAGFFADIGDLDAGRELHFLGQCQRLIFLRVENLRGQDTGGLVADFKAERLG